MLGLGNNIFKSSTAEGSLVSNRVSFIGLLNETYGADAEAAYSVRKLSSSATVAMTIRRESDNEELAIGFVDGNINEAAIEAHCTGTTCRVASWKDQSGNDNHATQDSEANQPTIYTGGALVKVNGKVALDTNDDHFLFNSTISFANDFTQFLVTKKDLTNNSGSEILSPGTAGTASYSEGFNGGGLPVLKNTVGSQYVIHSSLNNNFAMTTADQQKLIFANRRGTTGASALDGGAEKTATASFTGTVSYESILGNTAGGFHSYDGFAQEAIFYADDKSSFRASIEENVADYFTQNTPLLDTYSGAAAAYSLRKLSSSYSGPAIRVRRDNDNSETDINFNVFGELDTVSLAAHCGSNNGYVTDWYDQSSNSNTARQTTAANQPKIYDGTTGVVTENGKAAVQFDGLTSTMLTGITPAIAYPSNEENTTIVIINPADNEGMIADNDPQQSYGISGGRYRLGGETPNVSIGISIGNQSLHFCYGNRSASEMQAFRNGTLQNSGTTLNAHSASSETTYLGSFAGSRRFQEGKYQEVIIYPSDQSDNRTGIETNIATFYDITI